MNVEQIVNNIRLDFAQVNLIRLNRTRLNSTQRQGGIKHTLEHDLKRNLEHSLEKNPEHNLECSQMANILAIGDQA